MRLGQGRDKNRTGETSESGEWGTGSVRMRETEVKEAMRIGQEKRVNQEVEEHDGPRESASLSQGRDKTQQERDE